MRKILLTLFLAVLFCGCSGGNKEVSEYHSQVTKLLDVYMTPLPKEMSLEMKLSDQKTIVLAVDKSVKKLTELKAPTLCEKLKSLSIDLGEKRLAVEKLLLSTYELGFKLQVAVENGGEVSDEDVKAKLDKKLSKLKKARAAYDEAVDAWLEERERLMDSLGLEY